MSIVPAVAHHHERWNGTGYPDGLAGEAIPLQARILATADAFDAMTTTRPYRPGMPIAEAKRELVRCRGEQFDPSMVDALLRVLDSGRVVVHPQSTKAAS
jgi:HD-GYP domain-containing protein (c-di-GMP phosphodiesterase class II)